jgi:hypothetical protein
MDRKPPDSGGSFSARRRRRGSSTNSIRINDPIDPLFSDRSDSPIVIVTDVASHDYVVGVTRVSCADTTFHSPFVFA